VWPSPSEGDALSS